MWNVVTIFFPNFFHISGWYHMSVCQWLYKNQHFLPQYFFLFQVTLYDKRTNRNFSKCFLKKKSSFDCDYCCYIFSNYICNPTTNLDNIITTGRPWWLACWWTATWWRPRWYCTWEISLRYTWVNLNQICYPLSVTI